MYYVYIIQSELDDRYYYGLTTQSVDDRLSDHNNGKALYTKKYRPWKLIWYGAFSTRKKAEAFECYLKGGSGHAFSRKRLM